MRTGEQTIVKAANLSARSHLKLFTGILASRLTIHVTSENLLPKLQRPFCGYDGTADCNFLVDAV